MDSIGEGMRAYDSLRYITYSNSCIRLSFWGVGKQGERVDEGILWFNVRFVWFERFCTLRSMSFRSDTLGQPSKQAIFMQTVMPVWYLQIMSKYSRSRRMVHARHTARLANEVAQALIDMKSDALLHGRENKDILSLLGKIIHTVS